jgi:hypothetical protein
LTPATSRIPYPISVKQQPNGQWLAQVLGWAGCQAEAASREAAIVLSDDRHLADISNAEVRSVLDQTGLIARVYGRNQDVAAAQLDQFEHQIAA